MKQRLRILRAHIGDGSKTAAEKLLSVVVGDHSIGVDSIFEGRDADLHRFYKLPARIEPVGQQNAAEIESGGAVYLKWLIMRNTR